MLASSSGVSHGRIRSAHWIRGGSFLFDLFAAAAGSCCRPWGILRLGLLSDLELNIKSLAITNKSFLKKKRVQLKLERCHSFFFFKKKNKIKVKPKITLN
jgi:hypothetical protein